MFKFFKPRNSLAAEKVVDQITTLVSVRICLTCLRTNRSREAITSLEIMLDSLVTSLARSMTVCEPMTKEMLKEELRKVWRYRKENAEEIGNFLTNPDELTRKRLLEMRTTAQNTLDRFSGVRES
jgi:hypothetical protein